MPKINLVVKYPLSAAVGKTKVLTLPESPAITRLLNAVNDLTKTGHRVTVLPTDSQGAEHHEIMVEMPGINSPSTFIASVLDDFKAQQGK